MTCGLGLGILVVFLVQAELVCCLWTKGAQSFQNSNTYVGFQPDGSLIKSGSYPQNQVRQGFSPHSVQSRSFNAGPAVASGSGPGLSTRSSTQVVSQPAQSSVRLVKSSSVLKANKQRPFSLGSAAPQGARQSFAGGPSVIQTQKNPSISSRSWPTQQGTQRFSKYPSSSSRSLQASRGSYSFRSVSPQSAAQAPPRTAAKTSSHNSKTGSSAILFDPAAPGQRGRSVQTQTNARGPAKRVFSNRRSEGQKARRLSPQTQPWKPTLGHQMGSRPKSWLPTYKTSHNLAVPRSSTMGAPGQGFASAAVYEIPENFGGFAIRRLKPPSDQNQLTVQKKRFQIPTAAPQWMVPSTSYVQKVHPEARWTRIKLR
ncbi:uncharacterized protein LOC119425994 [Nematolebias whitei]|uniref:uncharacterized protein LOC119425994 n=1 Tax=Nematolebias whitei TaxID=451745 RepID=UPI00189B80A3|nr:uncharacterized protein LOC119425994 [Nematolebias whitei]